MNQKLAKAISIAASGLALSVAASNASAHVSYNLNTSTANFNAVGPWTGGAPNGYVGKLPVTWVANIHNDVNPNASYEVSTADAVAEGGANVVIESLANRWNPARSWGNALDFGLIDLHASANLTIRVAGDAASSSTFLPGFTLWQGWDLGTGNKHGAWNATPTNPGNRGATGISYLGHASTASSDGGINYSYNSTAFNAVEITFTNLAAGKYSLWIGGNGTVASPAGSQRYIANISASPVPLPGAIWLFGTAFMGLIGIKRRSIAS